MFVKVEKTLMITGVVIWILGIIGAVILLICGAVQVSMMEISVKGTVFFTYYIYAICTLGGCFIESILLYGFGELIELTKKQKYKSAQTKVRETETECGVVEKPNDSVEKCDDLEVSVLDAIKSEFKKEYGDSIRDSLYFGEKRTQILVDIAGKRLDGILTVLENKGLINCAGIGKRPLGFISLN